MATTERIADVESRSAGFRKELGLVDLALIQIVYVVGSGWVGTAAKLGTAHIGYWLVAIASFYLPQAAVVIFLTRLLPLEGGLYQWATVGLGRFLGYLVAWNLWAYTIVVMAAFAVMIPTNFAYLVGPWGSWLTGRWWYTLVGSGLAIGAVTVLSVFGLRIGKWVQNVGGIAHVLTFVALIAMPFVALARGTIAAYHPLAASAPPVSAYSLNIFGKMALGAFSGFEYVAILAGECRSPSRLIGRSVIVAIPIIATMFILGTSSVLAVVPIDKIDLVSPIPQALTLGFRGLPFAPLIVPALILLLLLRQIGTVTLIFAGNTRLPMVAGWDGLLPSWFTRLHQRFMTPTNSILFVGAVTLAFTIAGQVGVGVQEAFQLLDNAAGILYAFAYVALFAIPIFGARRLTEMPPLWLRAASVVGLAVSVLYCVLSVFPIIDVASWQVFAAKIITVLVVTNVIGLTIWFVRQRRALTAKALAAATAEGTEQL